MKITFLRTPKPRRFSHKPIYYDPAKEEHQERMERINKELGVEQDENYSPSIKRGDFRRFRWDDVPETKTMRHERRASNWRLLLIIVVLLLLAVVLVITSGDYLAL